MPPLINSAQSLRIFDVDEHLRLPCRGCTRDCPDYDSCKGAPWRRVLRRGRDMQRILAIAFVVLILLASMGCSPVTVQDYAGNSPAMVPEEFFDGTLRAHGVIKDRGGKVIRYFNVDIKAYWRDGVGTLEEDFIFNDGEKDRRVWTLTPNGTDRYIGTAGDVVGEGVISVAGNSMFLDYVLRIPYGDDTLDLRIDDRMYLVSDSVLVNESSMTKFGLKVGEILLVIERN